MLFLPLRYLTLVPATLIIYAGTLFNVINVSACSTNTDNFLSLRTPQHLHRKAEDSYEISLLAEVVAGLFHLPMYSGDSEWTGTQCIGRRTFSLISHGIKNNFFALIIKNEVILQ